MAGFVSTEAKWIKFKNAWNAVLNKYEVPYLHMKDFTCSTGIFKTWRGDEERRKRFLIDLIKVAKKGVRKGFSCSVLLHDFEDVNRDFRLREHWGSEYAFVGMSVVTAVMNSKKKHFPHDRIKYIFEDGDAGNEHLNGVSNLKRFHIRLLPKKRSKTG